jgi:hypothetical protein
MLMSSSSGSDTETEAERKNAPAPSSRKAKGKRRATNAEEDATATALEAHHHMSILPTSHEDSDEGSTYDMIRQDIVHLPILFVDSRVVDEDDDELDAPSLPPQHDFKTGRYLSVQHCTSY